MSLVVSCETGGSALPTTLADVGDARAEALKSPPVGGAISSTRGDPSARYAARSLASALEAPFIANEFSPSLIDVSRCERHRRLFPSWARSWPPEQRQWLIEHVHRPYRAQVRQQIARKLLHHRYVIHLSIRTFDAVHRGKHRRADMGLLYDPGQQGEVDFCLDWIDGLYQRVPMVRVRRNYPRRGTSDSMTRAMRTQYAGMNYFGIEVHLNRAWAARNVAARDVVLRAMSDSLTDITHACRSDAA